MDDERERRERERLCLSLSRSLSLCRLAPRLCRRPLPNSVRLSPVRAREVSPPSPPTHLTPHSSKTHRKNHRKKVQGVLPLLLVPSGRARGARGSCESRAAARRRSSFVGWWRGIFGRSDWDRAPLESAASGCVCRVARVKQVGDGKRILRLSCRDRRAAISGTDDGSERDKTHSRARPSLAHTTRTHCSASLLGPRAPPHPIISLPLETQ
jgi:hypothetical protein